MNRDADVQTVKCANEIDDSAKQVNTLIVDYPQSVLLRQYTQILLRHNYKRLLESAHTKVDAQAWHSRVFDSPSPHDSAFSELQVLCAPRKVLITTLENLPSLLDGWSVLFSNPNNMIPNELLMKVKSTGLFFDLEQHYSRNQKDSETTPRVAAIEQEE